MITGACPHPKEQECGILGARERSKLEAPRGVNAGSSAKAKPYRHYADVSASQANLDQSADHSQLMPHSISPIWFTPEEYRLHS